MEHASRWYTLDCLSYTHHWRSPSVHFLPETKCFSLLPLFLQTTFFLIKNRSFQWTPFFFFFLILPFPPLSHVCMNARQSHSYQVHLQVSPDHAVFVAVTHQGDSNCTCYYSSAQIEKKSTYLLLLCTVVPFPPVSSVCQILMLSLSLLAAVSPWKKHLPAHTPLPGQLGTVPRFCSFILSVIKLCKHYMWFHQY